MAARPVHLRLLAPAAAGSAVFLALLVWWLRFEPGSYLVWLAWNLALAWAPVALGVAVLALARADAPAIVTAPLAAAWLLLLPNAPYLVTDLVHVGHGEAAPRALTITLLVVLAGTGIALFVAAVSAMEAAVEARRGSPSPWIAPAAIWLSGVGIYLGRVLRWNSWDVLGDPLGRVTALGAHLSEPGTLGAAAAFTAALGALLHASYVAVSRALTRASNAA